MHKLISKKEAMMTRFLTLENVETGTVDYCFDDSDLFNDAYYPMEEGHTYECMIVLFGGLRQFEGAIPMLCHVTRDDVILGSCQSRNLEVQVEKDIYYIPYADTEGKKKGDDFYFYLARKDLIMVDGVLSGYYYTD